MSPPSSAHHGDSPPLALDFRVRFPRLPGLTNGKRALSRATLRRRQGVLPRMTSSCLSGTDRLSADAVAVVQRHIHGYIFTRPLVDPAWNFRCTNCTNLLADRRPNRPKPVQWMCNGCAMVVKPGTRVNQAKAALPFFAGALGGIASGCSVFGPGIGACAY